MKYSLPSTLAFLTAAQILGVSISSGQEVTFRSDVRLVEVYATVFDHHGRTIPGIAKDQFQILDQGHAQPIEVFEPSTSSLACALLLDTTGSMAAALPSLKNSAAGLIGSLRSQDAVAVYSFSTGVEELQEFTTDRVSARRALARLHASGKTALFDAVSQLATSLEHRPGKKVIIVFTDGNDNASALNLNSASGRARKVGIPIYSIAEGDATRENSLLKLLKDLARSTGGQSYIARNSSDIDHIFTEIAIDLKDTYLLAYRQPDQAAHGDWRTIEVRVLSDDKEAKVRARSGYQPE